MKVKSNLEAATGDFWYDLTDGGYLKPSEILESAEEAKAVEEAVALLRKFRDACVEQIPDFLY